MIVLLQRLPKKAQVARCAAVVPATRASAVVFNFKVRFGILLTPLTPSGQAPAPAKDICRSFPRAKLTKVTPPHGRAPRRRYLLPGQRKTRFYEGSIGTPNTKRSGPAPGGMFKATLVKLMSENSIFLVPDTTVE